jgi:Family of unknown function (DUF5317)
MILFLATIGLAIVLGYVFGGRLRRIEMLRLRWWWFAVAGFAIQFVPLPEGDAGRDLVVRTAVLAISYTLLLTFGFANVRLPGMPLVVIGLAANFLVIAVNGGMPVSEGALQASDQPELIELLRESGSDKHHLLTEDDHLTFLADVIGVPSPVAQAISIGDVFVYVGLVLLIVAAMRGVPRSETPTTAGAYRGRHRRGAGEDAIPEPLLSAQPAATRSGSAP